MQEESSEFAFKSELLVIAGSTHVSRSRNRLWLLCPLSDFENFHSMATDNTLFYSMKSKDTKLRVVSREIQKDICHEDDLFSNSLPRSGTESSLMGLEVEEST